MSGAAHRAALARARRLYLTCHSPRRVLRLEGMRTRDISGAGRGERTGTHDETHSTILQSLGHALQSNAGADAVASVPRPNSA